MNTLSADEIKRLIQVSQPPCISIFVPIYDETGTEIWQGQQRLRNLLHAVRQPADQIANGHQKALWKPIEALVSRREIWLQPHKGLAIWRSPEFFHFSSLPYRVKEQGLVGNHFYLKPLLPLLTHEKPFYILALSHNEVRLLKATHYTITELALPPSVPSCLADSLGESNTDNEVEYHSSASGATIGKGGRRPVAFHGQGFGNEDEKRHLLRYFQKIDRGLHMLLQQEMAPLVLASAEFLWPIYREANTYPHLLPEGVAGNADHKHASASMLHQRAWPLVASLTMQEQRTALARFAQERGSERTSDNVSEVVPAACEGRIKDLFVASDREIWGTYNQAGPLLNIHDSPQADDEDLLDFAARQTLLHGGAVYTLAHAEMPGTALLAATYRYV